MAIQKSCGVQVASIVRADTYRGRGSYFVVFAFSESAGASLFFDMVFVDINIFGCHDVSIFTECEASLVVLYCGINFRSCLGVSGFDIERLG